MKDKELEHVFVDGNKFYIMGVFDESLLKEIIVPLTRKIEDGSQLKEPPTLDFYINSPGGSGYIVMHLIRLFELAQKKGFKIRTIVPQYAYSAGSMLAIAGTKGERYIGETAEHLPHYGQQYGGYLTTPLQIERTMAHKKRWFKGLIDHYKKYSNIPDIDEKLKDDDYFITAKNCIRWGLADKYMEEL